MTVIANAGFSLPQVCSQVQSSQTQLILSAYGVTPLVKMESTSSLSLIKNLNKVKAMGCLSGAYLNPLTLLFWNQLNKIIKLSIEIWVV